MTLFSYAQNLEDVMLWRALGNVTNGFYIDVGAADPSDLSVTRVFYERGWRGINLEPGAGYFGLLQKARPGDINLRVGAAREAGKLLFHDVGGSGLSTFDASVAGRHGHAGWAVSTHEIETLPLSAVCRRYRPEGPIHFLKIDVEGTEADVLAGSDFEMFRPWIVLVEATLPGSPVESYEHWEYILTGQSYSFVWFDGVNRFYVADEMKPALARHFRVPANIFDGFAPSPTLIQRAEHAEQGLAEARASAARSWELQREAELHAARSIQQITASLVEHSRLTAQAQQRHTDELQARLHQVQARLEEAQATALFAQAQISWLLASTSWRVTMPLRAVRRLFAAPRQGHRTSAAARMAWAKQCARRAFYLSAKTFLALPGGARGAVLARRLAPQSFGWLARRYRVYGQHDGNPPPPFQLADLARPDPGCLIPPEGPGDVSAEEARAHRALACGGRGVPAHAAAGIER